MIPYPSAILSPVDSLLCAEPFTRTLLVSAHPDDEVIGAGSLLGKLHSMALLQVTDGAPRDMADARTHGFSDWREYAAARRMELENALEVAGAGPHPWLPLGFADQSASFHLSALARQIASVVDRFQPDVVLTHPYEGGHPDHDACAFAVWAAVRMSSHNPEIVEFSSYHLVDGQVRTGTFLGDPGQRKFLTEAQRFEKRRMFECFTTQQETLKQFDPEVECYRPAPCYQFEEPPHEGELHYERHPWQMTGARFCELVRRAKRELHL